MPRTDLTPPHHDSTKCGKRAGAFSPLEKESFQKPTMLQQAPLTLVSENVATVLRTLSPRRKSWRSKVGLAVSVHKFLVGI